MLCSACAPHARDSHTVHEPISVLHPLRCCLAAEAERSEVTPQLFERSMEELVNAFKAHWMVATTTVTPLCKMFSYFYYENTGPL